MRVFKKYYFVILLFVFGLTVWWINPIGEFAVNDDWLFVRQVDLFTQGIQSMNGLIDPSFISQGLLGQLWVMLFKTQFAYFPFSTLRLLTLLVTVALAFVTDRILKTLEIENVYFKFFILALVLFNPILYTSAFSFMTENYFLLFFALNLLFFLKYLESNSWLDFGLALLFAGISLLCRQLGIVPFVAMLILTLVQKKFLKTAAVLVAVAGFMAVLIIWPKYIEASILSNLIELNWESIVERFFEYVSVIPYMLLFLSPLGFLYKFKKIDLVFLVLAIGISVYLWKYDVLPGGSVYYIENLHTKSHFKHTLSLFDNILFKFGISTLLYFAFLRFVYFFVSKEKNKTFDNSQLFLLLSFLGMLGILYLGNDFYDRYLLPSFYALVLLLSIYLKDKKPNWATVSMLVLVAIHILFLQKEFFSHTRLRWQQARQLQWETGYITDINVDGTYGKYFKAVKENDYIGVYSSDPTKNDSSCFIQQYTVTKNKPLFVNLEAYNEKLENKIENPRVYESKKKEIPNVKNHLFELWYKDEYFSPMYNLVGKQTFVGSWCK